MQTLSFEHNRTFAFGKTIMRSLHNLALFSFDHQSSISGDFFCLQFTNPTPSTIQSLSILMTNSRSNCNATRSYF
ncbi:hypothetical protein ACUHGC_04520 [Testudinibacter sp. P27/CKL/0425]